MVLVGDFANREAAQLAIKTLPIRLKNLQPWVRSVQDIQQQVVNKINVSGE